MKKYFTLPLVVFFWQFSEAEAQQSFETEFYGGTGITHFKVDVMDTESEYSFGSPLSSHLGINLLGKLTSRLQVSGQLELMRSSWRYGVNAENPNRLINNSPFIMRTNNYLNYSLGLRYNHQVKNKIFYLQAGIGGTDNRYYDFFNQRLGVEFKNHLTFRTEAGVKIYNKKSNYFVLGVRHQQGINRHTQETSEQPFGKPANVVSDRGSYTGIFVGYGIGSKKSKSIF